MFTCGSSSDLGRCPSLGQQQAYGGITRVMQLNTCTEPNEMGQLRQYVSRTLCRENNIEVGVFQITERLLKRRGQPCGIYFCLHGPRSVKLTAIWETEKNTILFYGSTGERFKQTKLNDSPDLKDQPEIANF